MNIPRGEFQKGITRRDLLKGALAGGALGMAGAGVIYLKPRLSMRSAVVIAGAENYQADLAGIILSGLRELGIGEPMIRGKRILLKPNLVEVHAGLGHINTHPLVVRGAVEAFLRLGAAQVLVGEGPGHRRDSLLVLQESGLGEVLREDRIAFVDLNNDALVSLPNLGRHTGLATLTIPAAVHQADFIVSMAKMKTHHWAGVTLSMKNLFGVMPGIVYGWPKNVLHVAGIDKSILDINATVKPHFAIVDGIVGMEGDGPIMGDPKQAGVLVMGANLPAVDATCARIMGIDPGRIRHLRAAENRLGPIGDSFIAQRGERIEAVRTDFALREDIPAQQGIRLS